MRRRAGTAGFTYVQVFLLLSGFVLASVVIFFLGFVIGKRQTEFLMAKEERVVKREMPAAPTPAEALGPADQQFFESMKGKAYRRMQETQVAEVAVAAQYTAPPAAARTPAAPAAAGTPTRRPTVRDTPAAVTPRPTRTPAPRPTPPSGRDEWADAGWTVQVNATTNPQQAQDLARSLRAKGYDAYTVQAPVRGQTWYRVRVGRFGSRDKAAELESRLKRREGLENAHVTPQ
ncbi:SPOR domain-containing protein [Candidatus Binatia bacterium]|nr:SPOR domain-containing protein [Candidatus Binatia bacterium]